MINFIKKWLKNEPKIKAGQIWEYKWVTRNNPFEETRPELEYEILDVNDGWVRHRSGNVIRISEIKPFILLNQLKKDI